MSTSAAPGDDVDNAFTMELMEINRDEVGSEARQRNAMRRKT